MWEARVLERSESKEKLIHVEWTVKYRGAGAAATFKRDTLCVAVGCLIANLKNDAGVGCIIFCCCTFVYYFTESGFNGKERYFFAADLLQPCSKGARFLTAARNRSSRSLHKALIACP